MSKIVIALGGNALLESGDERTYESQVRRAVSAFRNLMSIISREDVIITHGNGPQVGDLILRNQESKDLPPAMPMYALGAMSQGLIGGIIQEAYDRVRLEAGVGKESLVIITRTLVNEDDEAFNVPTKPVGRVYDEGEMEILKAKYPWKFVKTEKGWRRVVPSPKPLDILEKGAIQSALIAGYLPICVGGGGVPVIRKDDSFEGRDAVIDKDSASYILAHMMEADELIILTDVECAYINFGTDKQEAIGKISSEELEKLYKDGQFSKGSMGPKIMAAINFVKHRGKVSRIGKLQNVETIISGKSGTIVVP